MSPMTILTVVGARPNFMKAAPLHRALETDGTFTSRIVHTGQHYDAKMSDVFFRQLEMPQPHIYLGVGSGSHAEQTARIMTAFEEVVLRDRPDLVVVVGDVNSTLACTLVAAKCHVPVAHVEAGLRSFDRTMPEEINRLVTDALSDLLFVTEQSAVDNLAAEGVPADKVHFVGNIMIDALVQFRAKAAQASPMAGMGVAPKSFVLATLHRPANVDDPEKLTELVQILRSTAALQPVIFPIHPRTRARLTSFGLLTELTDDPGIRLVEPLGYLEFLNLMDNASLVLTDSGGIQEETTYLNVPCLTLRENTERPVTVEMGTNRLLPVQADAVLAQVHAILEQRRVSGRIPPLWDGHTAERIVSILRSHCYPTSQAN